MTRKEELEQKAKTIVDEFPIIWEGPTEWQEYKNYILAVLQHVEREVWEQVIERIETMMEPQEESTDDQVREFRDWCKQQQERL